jgi:putative phosphoserine phosphatase/1-acylglycerol-3-phosphate O-acyltransferase
VQAGTREIDEAPPGPGVGAFFDLDRTLLAGFSAVPFVRDALASGRLRALHVLQGAVSATRFQLGRLAFSALASEAAGLLRGVPEAALVELSERVFTERLAGDVYPEARALVAAHRRRGHTLAVVSSATRYQIEPLARDLGIPHVLCTRLEVEHGALTGRVLRPACWGEGKLRAAEQLAARCGVALERSWFYTDSHEDLPLLEAVGHPRPTNPTRQLATIAAARGWPARTFTTRGLPGVRDLVRTGLAVGSLLPSALVGLPVALLDGGWRRAVNVTGALWGELGTALADVSVRVAGEEHLWSSRPAVFIFNHQSAVDVLLLCKLLRRDFVGISKQEVRRNPIFGPLFALAGTVFIDRFHRARAIEALAPAVAALRRGLSVVIAPEGTRSPTPRPGRFKKGAFHLALAARVPIVPIVFRNTLDALPKHGVVIRPAVVDVVVHPPIPTTDWRPAELGPRIAAVERLYAETLEA